MNTDLSRYHGKGYTGLANLGNTCFMNACIQVLNHTYELNDYLLVKRVQYRHPELPDTALLREWVDLQTMMWSKNGAISPNKFFHHVQELAHIKQRDLFTGWAQNDMPEFLLFFLDCLHNSLARGIKMRITGVKKTNLDTVAVDCYQMLQTVYEKEYSEIMELFYAIYVSEIRSMDGKVSHTHKPEMFFVLDLPMPCVVPCVVPCDGVEDIPLTLYDCFDVFTHAEPLTGDNAWFNERTGLKEDVIKRITFWNLPKVLVITIKRFHPMDHRKRPELVQFPLEGLDLSKYVSGYHPQKYVYDLFGVCNHLGGVMGGHYTAFVKNSAQEWIHFNDTSHQMVESPEDVVTPMAYCLFYRIRPHR